MLNQVKLSQEGCQLSERQAEDRHCLEYTKVLCLWGRVSGTPLRKGTAIALTLTQCALALPLCAVPLTPL